MSLYLLKVIIFFVPELTKDQRIIFHLDLPSVHCELDSNVSKKIRSSSLAFHYYMKHIDIQDFGRS